METLARGAVVKMQRKTKRLWSILLSQRMDWMESEEKR